MKRFWAAIALLLTLAPLASAQTPHPSDSCAEFQQMVKKIYNFNTMNLPPRQAHAKEQELDRFWTTVKTRKQQFLPCLRTSVANPKSNPFFRFDGSNLLVALDPSLASKELQVRVYTAADLDMVGAQRWVSILCQRGTEGFDVSQAAARWMTDPKAHYVIPDSTPEYAEAQDFKAGPMEGALFLYGSMNEAQATPALLKIVTQAKSPSRDIALSILMRQATSQSRQALQKLDMTGFSPEAQQAVKTWLDTPPLIEPRAQPTTTRAEFLLAFQDIVKGKTQRFSDLVEQAEDGEKDAVAVLKPEDLPLLRKVRRRFVLGGTQHSLNYYDDFTKIIMTIIEKSQTATQPAA